MLDITVECAYPGCSRRFERLRVTGKYCPECRKNQHRTRDIKILRPGETRCSACRRIFIPSWDGQDLCYCCVKPDVVSPVQVRGYSPLKLGPMAYVYPVHVTVGKTVWDIPSPELYKYAGVDGEGIDTPDGHKYVLLGCGNSQYENPDGISWHEAFGFLWSCYLRQPGAVFAGYYLGYDFAQILKTLPADRAAMIFTEKGISSRKRKKKFWQKRNPPPFPAEVYAPPGQQVADRCGETRPVTAWQYDMLPPMRRLCIRPRFCACKPEETGTDCVHVSGSPWMWICDAGPFFQASLLATIDPRKWKEPILVSCKECENSNTPGCNCEFGILKRGKQNRGNAELNDEMRAYNRLENEILSRLLATLSTGFRDMGISLSVKQWFGPGQAAQAWMRENEVLDHENYEKSVPKRVRDVIRESYYGGRFEVFAHGHVPGVTHEYDINSAYPCQIAQLPCLKFAHGEWVHGTGRPPRGRNRWIVCKVRVRGTDKRMGGLPYRYPSGRIAFPRCTCGWYWLHEIDAARKAGLITEVSMHEWWCYQQKCSCEVPTSRIRDLYLLRQNMGKDTPAGKAAKLVYNSVYGKFAQSKGEPMYGNGVYASLITAGCRAQILEAIAAHPQGSKAVVMIATDAVYFTSEHPSLQTGEGLGMWDHKEKHNLTIFKPGVYWDSKTRKTVQDGQNPEIKSRGIPARDLGKHIDSADKKFRQWNQENPASNPASDSKAWPVITLKLSFAMITPRMALHRGKWDLAGKVTHGDIRTEEAWDNTKRNLVRMEQVNGIWFSRSWEGKNWGPSTPYDKCFGDEVEDFGWDSVKSDEIDTGEAPANILLREILGTG